jgi:hypothetical protein
MPRPLPGRASPPRRPTRRPAEVEELLAPVPHDLILGLPQRPHTLVLRRLSACANTSDGAAAARARDGPRGHQPRRRCGPDGEEWGGRATGGFYEAERREVGRAGGFREAEASTLWLDRSGGLMGGQGLEEGRRRRHEDERRRRWLGFKGGGEGGGTRGRTGSGKARQVGSDAGDERKANVRRGEHAMQGRTRGGAEKRLTNFLSRFHTF